MFSITPSELIVIAVIVLIVFGPRRMVELSRQAGKVAGQLRRTADELRTGLDDEIRAVKEPFDEVAKPFREAQSGLAAVGKELIETTDGELRWVDSGPAGDDEAPPADPGPDAGAGPPQKPEDTEPGGGAPA